MAKFIEAGVRAHLRMASIKHHGHGGKPEPAESQRDSERHFQAGAAISSVEGEGVLQMIARQEHWALEDILAIYQSFQVDAVLVEGYKRAAYPKVVMVGKQEDVQLLGELTNVCAVIKPTSVELESLNCPVFSREEELDYQEWFLHYIKKEK